MSLVDECISCASKLWTVKDCCAIKSATCVMAFESVAKITGINYLNPTAVSEDLDEHIIHGKTTSTRFWYMSLSFLSASLNFFNQLLPIEVLSNAHHPSNILLDHFGTNKHFFTNGKSSLNIIFIEKNKGQRSHWY